MSETLHIKNFGPIKDVKLELKNINILIGDQGTGKSTVAKVFSLIKNFTHIIIFNDDDLKKQEDNTWQFEKFLDTFEIRSYLIDNTEIFYNYESKNIEISYTNKKIKTNLKRTFKIPPNFNYIVAERVFVSTLADAFYGLNQFGTKLPTLFNRFGNKFSTARKERAKSDYNEILNVAFSHINGVDSVIMQDESIIPLSDASTGLQGTIPLLVVFDDIVEIINQKSNSAKIREHLLVIEEPELNLFPLTQKKLLDYIITNNFEIRGNDNEKTYKNQLLITTHSPYILTSLNNLMYAHQVGNMESGVHKAAVSDIIPQQNWINPDDVSCYLLKLDENGYSIHEDIKDKEGLIKSSMIDSVSRELNTEFNEIINIEIGVAK